MINLLFVLLIRKADEREVAHCQRIRSLEGFGAVAAPPVPEACGRTEKGL
jgi:hypothetical protein